MKCTRQFVGRRTTVALNGELLKEVERLKYMGSKITVDGGTQTEVKSRICDIGKVLVEMKVFSC